LPAAPRYKSHATRSITIARVGHPIRADETTAASLARAETEFLERHLLNWVPSAKIKLDRTGVLGFPVVMTLLAQFLIDRLDG
jgi:hypothetical protein